MELWLVRPDNVVQHIRNCAAVAEGQTAYGQLPSSIIFHNVHNVSYNAPTRVDSCFLDRIVLHSVDTKRHKPLENRTLKNRNIYM